MAVLLVAMPWTPLADRLNYFRLVERYPPGLVFLSISLLCVVAIAAAPFFRSPFIRVPVAALVVGGFAADYLFSAISGARLDADQIVMLWREKAMFSDALSGYLRPALLPVAGIAALTIAILWKPPAAVALRAYWALVPVLAVIACFVVVKRTLAGTSEFPVPIGVPAIFAVVATSSHYAGPRDDLEQRPAAASPLRRVVMIVDESIRGDYLGINNKTVDSTPYLNSYGGLVNFGPAVSGHNCSAAARLILRTGLRPEDLPDVTQRSLKAPAVWQFARNAGYETVYVDAFVNVFGSHSYMNKAEREFIDRSIPVGGSPVYLRDQKIAQEVLPGLLTGERPVFIYVNKYGSHFPYASTYPANFADEGRPAADDLDARDRLLESYRRAVRWSVDEFFRDLLGRIDLKGTLILYTSDHGQSLLEGGYKLSHCSNGKVHPGEGIVPLFALTGDPDLRSRLADAARDRASHATHFEVFPTLLEAMGYDESWVAKRYGTSLLSRKAPAARRFLTGDLFGLSRAARWIDVD